MKIFKNKIPQTLEIVSCLKKYGAMRAREISRETGIPLKRVREAVCHINLNRKKWKDIQIINHDLPSLKKEVKKRRDGDAHYELVTVSTRVRPIMANVNSHTRKAITQVRVGLQDQLDAAKKTTEWKTITLQILEQELDEVYRYEDSLREELRKVKAR